MGPIKKLTSLFAVALLASACAGGDNFQLPGIMGPSTKPGECAVTSGYGPSKDTVRECVRFKNYKRPLDLVLVINNSQSLEIAQWQLSDSIDHLFKSFHANNWRAGIVTADARYKNLPDNAGVLNKVSAYNPQYISKRDLNHFILLVSSVVLPESRGGCTSCPRSYASVMRTMVQSLYYKDTHNKGFFRDNSHLAFVVLSADKEYRKSSSSELRAKDVYTQLHGHFGAGKTLSVSGMAILPKDHKCLNEQRKVTGRGDFATQLADLSQRTYGLMQSICQSDYSSSLEKISQNINQNLVQHITLKHVPEESSIKVIDTKRPYLKIEWRLQGQKLFIDQGFGEELHLDIRYNPASILDRVRQSG